MKTKKSLLLCCYICCKLLVMKHFYCILIFALIVQLASAQSKSDNRKLLILSVNDKVPDSARFIKDIKVRPGLKTNFGYADAISTAKDRADDAGGNIIKFTELSGPDGWSSGFGLRADIYYKENIANLIVQKNKEEDAELNSLLPDTASYALLFVYRPRSGKGSIIQFNIHADDSQICRVSNGSYFRIKLFKKGPTSIWARTESRMDLSIDVKPGQIYFLKCSVAMGVMVGEPDFELIDPYNGYQEFKLCENHKERDPEKEKKPAKAKGKDDE